MKLTRSEEIALLLVVDVVRAKRKPLSLSEVAARHGLSAMYLKKIARQLKAAGILESHEGTGGGYTAGCDTRFLTVDRVIAAVSEPILPKAADASGVARRCPLSQGCLPETVRMAVSSAVGRALGEISVYTLSREEQGK